MRRFSASVKLKAVGEVLEKGKSPAEVASKYHCTRQSLFAWIKVFKSDPRRAPKLLENSYLKGKNHPKKLSWKIEKEILDIVIANPDCTVRGICNELAKQGYKVSVHGVYNILAAYNLQTAQLRHKFSLEHPVKTVFASSLVPAYRTKVVEEHLAEGKPISKVCKVWNVSRPTFYSWLKRYKEAVAGEMNPVEALSRKQPRGSDHHRYCGDDVKAAVLSIVGTRPELSVHKIHASLPESEGRKLAGHHAVQNILAREGLSTFAARARFAQERVQVPAPLALPSFDEPVGKLSAWRLLNTPYMVVPRWIAKHPKTWPLTLPPILFVLYIFEFDKLLRPAYFFPTIALTFGLIFFLYSLKYYMSLIMVMRLSQTGAAGDIDGTEESGGKSLFAKIGHFLAVKKPFTKANPLLINLEKVELTKEPFVSIHLAIYNEKKVIERLISACCSQQWSNYEIVIADDSTDETTELIKGYIRENYGELGVTKEEDGTEIIKAMPKTLNQPSFTLIHRSSRKGFKGAALAKALENSNPHAEFVVIFDSDFVPYPDTLSQFIKSFQETCGGLDKVATSKIAAVQGYQWHVLNKSQNWVTRGVRTEYSGSYVIERAGIGIYGGLNMIAGSVFCIRADVLRHFLWGTSITEDLELTLKLYEAGFKVVFTPYIQAPAEAVSTVKRLIRQRMRWAEGHTFNVRLMWKRLLVSRALSTREKFEFLYLAPYYLQAAFFLVGSLAWFLSEIVLKVRLPFWTAAWGWSLIFTNFLALPLMNLVGLFLEESDERDYLGIASFLVLSYILVPFQAYAAVKALFEKEEGPWFRTPKTGAVTDVFDRAHIYNWLEKLKIWGRPNRKPTAVSVGASWETGSGVKGLTAAYALVPNVSAFNHFNGYHFKPRRVRLVARSVLVFLLVISLSINYLVFFTPSAKAAGTTPALEQQINFTNSGINTASTSYTPTDNSLGVINWNSANYDGTTQNVYFEAVMQNRTGAGIKSSMVLNSSGYPVISSYDKDSGDLKVILCNDANCTGGDETIATVDGCSSCDSTGSVGDYNSIVIDSQTATTYHVSYYDTTNTNLKYATCTTSCGTAANWTVRCLVGDTYETSKTCLSSSSNNVGQYSNIIHQADFIGNDYFPAVAYYDASGGDLYYLHCSNNSCSTLRSGTPICLSGAAGCVNTSAIDAGKYLSMVSENTSTGDAYISYYDATDNSGDPMVAHCTIGGNNACDTSGEWSVNNAISDGAGANAESNNQGQYSSITLDSSFFPVVSFQDTTNTELSVAHCNDTNCSGSDETINVADTDGVTGLDTSIKLAGGNPVISHRGDPGTSIIKSLRVTTCNDANCAGSNETTNNIFGRFTAVSTGTSTSLALDASDNPVVAFAHTTTTTSGNLQLLHCNDAACGGENDPVNTPDPISIVSGTTITSTAGLFTSSGTQVTCSGSNIEVSTTNREYTRVRSSACTPANLSVSSSDLTVQVKSSSASWSAVLLTARLIITQADPTKLTKTQTHVEVGDFQTGLSSATYATLTNPVIYLYDSSKFTPNSGSNFAVYFEASLYNGNTTNTVYAQLFRCDSSSTTTCVASGGNGDAGAVTGSEVSCSNATTPACQTSYARVRSGDIKANLTDSRVYVVQYKVSAGSTSRIANAKLVIEQADATNGITALETVQVYNTAVLTPNTNNTYFIFWPYNSFNPANFTGTMSYFYETTMKVSNASGTATAQLYNFTDLSAIASSEITTSSTSYSRVRTASSLTMPSATKDMTAMLKCGTGCSNTAAYSYSNRISQLVIQISSLPVPEYAIFALPGIIFLPKIVSWLKRRRRLALVGAIG